MTLSLTVMGPSRFQRPAPQGAELPSILELLTVTVPRLPMPPELSLAELPEMTLPSTVRKLPPQLEIPPSYVAVLPEMTLPFWMVVVPPSLLRMPPPLTDAELARTVLASIVSRLPQLEMPPP